MSRPDFNLCIARKGGQEDGRPSFFQRVGAGWRNRSGRGYSIKLDDGVVLDWRMMDSHSVYLFPNFKEEPSGYAKSEAELAYDQAKTTGDDIPF